MSESIEALDVLARLASDSKLNFAELTDSLNEGEHPRLDPTWAAVMARVVAHLPAEADRYSLAEAILSVDLDSISSIDSRLTYRRLLAELRHALGDLEGARQLVLRSELRSLYHGYLEADLVNPFVTPQKNVDKWLAKFNRAVVAFGLTPLNVTSSPGRPFNRLQGTATGHVKRGPLVSVILTTYNAKSEDLRCAISSILNQTWTNLELILVDDCSPQWSDGALNALEALDSRLRVLRAPQNGGTYRARNLGLQAAKGEFVTGQDSDDWSHPERIERQMDSFLKEPHLPGVLSRAHRMDENLLRLAPGFAPECNCEVSLLFRRDAGLQLGGYLPVRKGGDSEFRMRLERWSRGSCLTLQLPLYMIRTSQKSLSRSEYRPGWVHQSRRAFRSAYSLWHEETRRANLCTKTLDGDDTTPFPVPARISRGRLTSGSSLCILGDWRLASSRMIDELRALADRTDVSIMHVDAPVKSGADMRRLVPEVQRLINTGRIRRLLPDEPEAIGTLIIREPSALHFSRRLLMRVRAARVLVVLDSDAVGVTYEPAFAERTAGELFGESVQWCAREGADAERLRSEFSVELLRSSYPVVVSKAALQRRLRSSVSDRPAIGRLAGLTTQDWPAPSEFELIYPRQGIVDVKVLGDAKAALNTMQWNELPSNWLEYRESETSASVFWRSVDVMVHYDRVGSVPIREDLLEAMMRGTAVIAREGSSPLLTPGLMEAAPHEAVGLAKDLSRDPSARNAIVERAQEFVLDRFPESRLLAFLEGIGVESIARHPMDTAHGGWALGGQELASLPQSASN